MTTGKHKETRDAWGFFYHRYTPQDKTPRKILKDYVIKVVKEKKQLTLVIGDINKACPCIVVIDFDDFDSLSCLVASSLRLQVNEWFGPLKDRIELGVRE